MTTQDAIAIVNAALEAGRDIAVPGIVGRGGILWAKCDRLRLDADRRGARLVRYGRVPRDSYIFGCYVQAAAGLIQARTVTP